jgi:DNA-binding GntR family transcriptional regulator
MAADLHRLDAAPDLVDRAYRALLDAICSGALPPGQRLTQEELASRLAVSRQPVLQALRLLKAEGLVQDAPGRGLLVAPLDAGAVRQVYQVRGALDVLAARLAAERRAVLSPALLRAGRQATRGKDVALMIEADLAFHRALYAASGNAYVARAAETHWSHLRRAMGAVLQQGRKRQSVWDEHEAITQAVARGDADAAADAAHAHTDQAASFMVARLSFPAISPISDGPDAAHGARA